MAELDPEQAYLLILHHDILLPGEQDADEAGNRSSVPPTRTETSYRFPLTDTCTIGRDRSCTIRVQEHRTDISREHVIIEREGDVYILRDRSRHGTFVNGQRITQFCQLDTGDSIGLATADEMLRFLDPARTAIALTEREIEVLRALATGLQKKEIAQQLAISLNTVSTHVKNIYSKLDASNVTEALNQARKLGLID